MTGPGSASDAQEALAGMRVVEIGGGLAPAIAALFFAELGADVIRIEPSSGDPSRGSAAFAVRNRSKRHLSIDLGTAPGDTALNALLTDADILIHDQSPSRAALLGLDETEFSRRHPALVIAHVGAFPRGHRLDDLPVIDSLALGAAGVFDEQAAIGRDGPAYLRFPLGAWGAGYLAACGTLAKLIARDRGNRAGPVGTSLVQGALTSLAMLWYRAERPSPSLAVGMPKSIEPPLFLCSDGVWLHLMANCDHVPLMAERLAELPSDVLRPAAPTTTYARLFPLMRANRAAFAQMPSAAWLETLWAADIPIQPVRPMGALYADAQAEANDFVVDVNDPLLGETRQPALPLTLDPPARVRSPAGLAARSAAWQPLADEGGSRIRLESPENAPLAGVRILDFGNFVAGPFAMMLAADLGANVIKIEATSGDQMRWIDWGFNGSQRGKRALALQLKDPRAASVLRRLVAGVDVVHHNLRMPAARKLGLDYPSLSAINPALVYCHVNSYGSRGAKRDWPGYDQLFQALSGWESETTGPASPPAWLRFGMMDHHAAMASLIGTLALIRRRDRTGEGGIVNASLMAAAMLTMSETVMYSDGALAPYARVDENQTGVSPSERLYRCRDGWIMLHCPDAAIWLAILAALGATADAAAGFAALDQASALALVHRAGGDAVEVGENRSAAFFDDPDSVALGLTCAYRHARFGKLEQVGSFWHFDGRPATIERPPPMLGEHSREILAEIGYGEAAIADMIAEGLIVATDA